MLETFASAVEDNDDVVDRIREVDHRLSVNITSAQRMTPGSSGTLMRSMASAPLIFAGRYRPGSRSA
jgi:hypothetical protein